MLRGVLASLSSAVLLLAIAAAAHGAPASRPEREAAPPEPIPGTTHHDPFTSPHGLALRGSHGFEVVVGAVPAERGVPAQAFVEVGGPTGTVRYEVHANLADEGIRANFGPFGRIDLRWMPNGRVREVSGTCRGYRWHRFYDAGSYVGTLRFRGQNGFTTLRANRIPWRRTWYGPHSGCPITVSEGFPGPGAILEAGPAGNIYGRVHLFVVQDAPGAEVSYSVQSYEKMGRIGITRAAFATGGPKTITVGPGWKTAEISPPAPFSGTGRFERTEGARGTWLGDLALEFLDGTSLRLAGKAFEGVLHSGYYEVHEL